jgi:hypothetical protein
MFHILFHVIFSFYKSCHFKISWKNKLDFPLRQFEKHPFNVVNKEENIFKIF